VTDSDDVASRGRAIFQRLRAHEPDTAAEPAGSPPGDELHDGGAPGADRSAQEPTTSPEVEEGSSPTTDTAPEEAVVDRADHDVDAPPVAQAPGRAPLPGAVDLAELVGSAPGEDLAVEVEEAVGDAAAAADEAYGAVLTTGALEEPATIEPDPLPAPVVEGHAEPEPTVGSGFARDLPRIMAVANQKGGVGKTTTAVNLGACLADIGYRVLVVDLDPQGNASTGLGINIRDLQGSMYDVILHDLPIEDCVEATSVRNLFCAPSSLDLAGAEIELVPAFSRELRLKRALEEVRDDYDFVLIDCPPSLGLLTVNGLAAATEVVVPIQCEYYALEGLGQLLRNVNLVQRNLNPSLELSAIVLVMYDARTKLADQVVSEVREHFGAKVCRNVIPRTVRLSEAPSFGQPIIAFDSSSRGAIAYRELAKEVSGGTPQRAR